MGCKLEKKINNHAGSRKDSLKPEDNNQEIKNILPNYEDIFN